MVSVFLHFRKAQAPFTARQANGESRGGSSSAHRSNSPFDPEGQGAGANVILEKPLDETYSNWINEKKERSNVTESRCSLSFEPSKIDRHLSFLHIEYFYLNY